MTQVAAINNSPPLSRAEAQRENAKYKPDWKRWAVTRDGTQSSVFLPYLRGVIPHDATISQSSNPNLVNSRGKAVGHRNLDGTWSGTRDWTSLRTTLAQAKKAERDGASIGLQGVLFPAIDGDIDNPLLAEGVQQLAFRHLGRSFVRSRAGSSRFLIIFHISDGERQFEKRQIKFIDETSGASGAVEFLGAKQMYLVDGLHKSGVPYEWDIHPCDVTPADIPRIARKQVDPFFSELADYLDMMSCKLVSNKTNSSGGAQRNSIDDPARRAPSPQRVLDLLKVWSNTPENVPTHIEFVCAIAAIKTALGPDREDYYPDVEQWALGYDGNTPQYIRERWDSIS